MNLVDGGMVRHWVRMRGVVSPIVKGSSGAAQGIDLVDGCVFGRVLGDRQSCGHLPAQDRER